MRKAALLMISTVLLTTAASADVVRRHSVPERFRGRWLGTNGSVMELTARSYVSREANCTVDWVSKIAGARGSTYSASLQCTNAAERTGRRVSSNLIIRPIDTGRIAAGPEFTRLINFRRCAPVNVRWMMQHRSDGLLLTERTVEATRARAAARPSRDHHAAVSHGLSRPAA
jgi:hypothetical protein